MSNLISKECVDLVKKFEGFYPTPYYDLVGVRTLGYGMTGKEIEGLSAVTEKQASDMLENLLDNKYALPIKNDLDRRGIKLTQNQFDALVSMAYNIGVGGVLGSTLYENICNGVRDKATITANFQAWSNAGGKIVEGLFRRRTEEAEMFFKEGNKIMLTFNPIPLVCTQDLNCWGERGNLIKKFKAGDAITAIGCLPPSTKGQSGWWKLNMNGEIGWVLAGPTKRR